MTFDPHEPVLYHYTSQKNLVLIVSSRKLWISNVYYTNDANEIKYGAALFRGIIAERLLDEPDATRKEFLGELAGWISQLTGMPHYLFVFSLTEAGNLLSRWRAYTPTQVVLSS